MTQILSTTASQILGWDMRCENTTVVVTDSSGKGLGGIIFSLGRDISAENVEWFCAEFARVPTIQCLLDEDTGEMTNICPAELLAAVIGISSALKRGAQTIIALYDNMSSVSCINKRSSRSHTMNRVVDALNKNCPEAGHIVTA
ncbi:hypothetical protein FOZ63_012949, partial [Perkinsus olseni]